MAEKRGWAEKEKLERVQAALIGSFIGDAMGMPVEAWSAERIKKLNKGKGVSDFIEPKEMRTGWEGLHIGDITDDTQLMSAVARSIIRCRGWNLTDCMNEYVYEFERSTFGWGSATVSAVRDYKEGRRIDLHQPPSYIKGRGAGNGALMVVAPLALFEIIKQGKIEENDLAKKCMELAFLTHSDVQAGFAAYAGALVITRVINQPIRNTKEGKQLLPWLINSVSKLEEKYRRENWPTDWNDTVLTRLRLIPGVIKNTEAIRDQLGVEFHSRSTVSFTIATFLRHPNDFRQGILEAVNAGGDTDTQASIVGAMIGANSGLTSMPKEWIKFRPKYAEAFKLGKALYGAANF